MLDMQNAPPPLPNSPPPGSVRETAVDYCGNDARLLKDGGGQAKGTVGAMTVVVPFVRREPTMLFVTVVSSLSHGHSTVLVITLSENKLLRH